MTDHPAKAAGCSPRQIEVFEQIAEGITNPPASKKTLDALAKKGLIDVEWETVGWCSGAIKVPRWFVPIPVHIQWCEWCAEKLEAQGARA